MPDRDVTLTAEFEYNPANPANPARNYWNKDLGEVIVDEFTTGSLANAVKSVIGDNNTNNVQMITVAGVMNTTDFGIINTYSACTLLDLSRVSGISQVPSYAFDYTNIKSVYLPASIEKIGNRAFYECKQLSSLFVYAMTPPTLESNVFTNVSEDLVVYVPAAAIAQYQEASGWKNFTLLPIQEDIRSISISLPDGSSPQDYAQMWLELTNTKSGQRMHYVMTERQTYTFANIIRNTSWNVTLRNERGDVFGQIDNVEVKDEDVTVTFASLSKPQNVSLSVLTPDGNDVTSQVQVTWTDARGKYVAQGASLSGLPAGYQVNYRMVLSQGLAMAYETPSAVEYTLADGGNSLTCQLQAIKKLTISGNVKDASTGLPLSGAVISASQTFGGKYSKTLNAKTDGNGVFTMEIFNVPTSVAIAATDYISQTLDYSNNEFSELTEFIVPDVSLKSITGATISVGFTYTTVEGETQNWYSDYQNVGYTLYNITREKPITQFNVQYPQIVLLEEVEDGDVLRLTATSRTNAFKSVETTAIVAEQRAETTFAITELGRIEALFSKTGNAMVVGSLYDAAGKLVKTYDYANAKLTISDLTDGIYTLVSMGSSQLFNTIYDLAQLPQTGLVEGSDYVQNVVEVKSGTISPISIDEVPTLDESKLYYTGDNTSFTVNKPSIVAGNYLTLTGRIDFKPAYATNVSNVQMIVDLPESCQFVENSVMVGNSTSSYTLNGKRITIPMTRYTDRVRFCIIPTLGGEYAPSAFAQFDLNGETVMQPIGSANYTAKDLSISVPSIVDKTSIPVSGTAIGTSSVEIYDNGVLIGQTTSLANGTWATTCELNEPYNLSIHGIYAKVTTKQALELQSEMVSCQYDMNAIKPKTVTMSFYNSWLRNNVYVVFDFSNYSTSTSSYMFYKGTDITFMADLTNNDTTMVQGVTINVYTDKHEVRKLRATYDKKTDRWVAVSHFESKNLPVNIDVDIVTKSSVYADRTKYNTYFSEIDVQRKNITDVLTNISNLETEAKDIEIQETNNHNSYLALLSVLNGIDNDDETLEKLVDYLNATNLSSTVSIEDFTPNLPKDITQQYVDDLLARIDSLVNNQVVNDFTKVDSLMENATHLLSEQNDSIDIMSSLKTALSDTVTIETKDGIYQFRRIAIDFAERMSIVDADTAMLEMTDGSSIMVLFNESNEMLVIDSISRTAWVIELIEGMAHQNFSKAFRVKKGAGFVDSMNEARKNIELLINSIYSFLKGIIDETNDELNKLKVSLDDLQSERAILLGRSAGTHQQMEAVERELRILQSKGLDDFSDIMNGETKQFKINELKAKRLRLLGEIDQMDGRIKNLEKLTKGLNAKIIGVAAFLGQAKEALDLVQNAYTTIYYAVAARNDHQHWYGLIDNILPCPDDDEKARRLKAAAEDNWTDIAWEKGYYPAVAITGISTIINGYMMTNKGAKFLAQFVVGILTDFMTNISSVMFKKAQTASRQWYPMRYNEYLELSCSKRCGESGYSTKCPPPPNDDSDDSGNEGDFKPIKPIHDPSGYVYEGVFSNRIEGATATVYYKEEVEDMYGDLHENIVKWDASEYAQENPLFTDENGFYRWDVPQGLWQVKFEKEGYETTYSEWLPVPPPQLDVNIAMKQNVQPTVKLARAYEDAVEVEFDKYMMPELLTTDNIMVMQGSKAVAGSVELLNNETSYEGSSETFASKIRFNAAQPFTEQEITLMVSNRVKSYAGIRMQDDYQQAFTIEQEIKQIVSDSLTLVGYGEKATLTVNVLPALASKGKMLTVKTSSPMILGVETEQVVIGNDGKAEISISGELPGTAAMIFSVEGTDKTAVTVANVEQIVHMVATPLASIASGTEVEKGTKIELSCGTGGSIIYYTLDGSCPCDNTAARKIYDGTPIVIYENTVIKIMATADNMFDSDVAVYTYTVKDPTGISDITLDGQIQISPLPVRDKLNVTANDKLIKSVAVTSMNGVVVASSAIPAKKVSLDVSTLPAGIYIISVTTEDGILSRKILKV